MGLNEPRPGDPGGALDGVSLTRRPCGAATRAECSPRHLRRRTGSRRSERCRGPHAVGVPDDVALGIFPDQGPGRLDARKKVSTDFIEFVPARRRAKLFVVGVRHVSGFRPAWLFVTDGSPRCWSGVCLPRPGQKSFPDRTLQEPSQLYSCTLELNNHLINLRYCSKEDLV